MSRFGVAPAQLREPALAPRPAPSIRITASASLPWKVCTVPTRCSIQCPPFGPRQSRHDARRSQQHRPEPGGGHPERTDDVDVRRLRQRPAELAQGGGDQQAFGLDPLVRGRRVHVDPGRRAQQVADRRGTVWRGEHHASVVGDAVGKREHWLLAAPVHQQRNARDPFRLPGPAIRDAKAPLDRADPVGQGLDRLRRGRPVCRVGAMAGEDQPRGARWRGDERLDLQRIADHHRASRAPERSDRGLRRMPVRPRRSAASRSRRRPRPGTCVR